MQFLRLKAAGYSVCSALGLLAFALSPNLVNAQGASEQFADNDHPLIARFPDSEIVEYEVSDELNHQLVLGTLQRTRGEVVPEASERLKGRVTRIVYAVPSDYQVSDVREFFSQQLRERGDEVLFHAKVARAGVVTTGQTIFSSAGFSTGPNATSSILQHAAILRLRTIRSSRST